MSNQNVTFGRMESAFERKMDRTCTSGGKRVDEKRDSQDGGTREKPKKMHNIA